MLRIGRQFGVKNVSVASRGKAYRLVVQMSIGLHRVV